jgi:endonuclease/exonuclease/phosphatase family metal-dependent hydrolase
MIFLLIPLAVLLLVAGGTLLFLMITEYRPKPVETLSVGGINRLTDRRIQGLPDYEFTVLSWNIGYAGLGKEEDFFFDGGKGVQPSEAVSGNNLNGIISFVRSQDTVDFIFLQEIDQDSKRSYHTDQVTRISGELSSFIPVFAMNYDCRYIPVLPCDPIGKVRSGLLTLSRWGVASATRYQYEANFPWPKRLVFLKRCFLAERIPLDDGKELVMINLHNSAFDYSGRLRKAELKQLQGFLDTEYAKGNYVVAGGDWNSNPRGFFTATIKTGDKVHDAPPPVEEDFIPGWTFAFDPAVPSNRNVDRPYQKSKTGTTVIDFFVASPNIEVKKIRTIDLGFGFSDHNPVLMTFELR